MIEINWASQQVLVSGELELTHDDMGRLEAMFQREAAEIVTGPENNDQLESIHKIAAHFGMSMQIDALEDNGAISPA